MASMMAMATMSLGPEELAHLAPEDTRLARERPTDLGAPEVSIVIPHYNDLENLGRCLALLSVQTYPEDKFEIVVADNNSSCGLDAVAKLCEGRARVVAAPIQGAGEARNAGIAASRGRVLAFIDSDCRPTRDWLERGVKALEAADMVGGAVDVDVIDENALTAVEAFERVFAFNFKRYIEEERFSGSGNMFVSRRVFDSVGEFRVGVPEDKDWGRRASALGFRWLYAPEVRVSHPARRDWRGLQAKWRRGVRESYLLTLEQPFGKLRWLLRAWLVLISPFVHALIIMRSPKLTRIDFKLKAIYILFRLRWWRFAECHRILFSEI